LNCFATGREREAAVVRRWLGEADPGEVSEPVGGREAGPIAEPLAAVLEGIATRLEPGDRLVARHRRSDLPADLRGAGEAHLLGQLGPDASCELAEDPPLGPRLGDPRPLDLRAEDHATLG
jgi:hypothetical protein